MYQLLVAQAGMQFGQSLLQGQEQQQQVRLQNQAKAASNLQTVMETADSVNSISRQALSLRDNAAKMRMDAREAAQSVRGSAEQQIAAAGVRGASVDAVLSDIDRELGVAETAMVLKNETDVYNLNTRLQGLVSGARSSIYRLTPELSDTSVFMNAAIQGGMAAGQTYAANYFQFNSGGEA